MLTKLNIEIPKTGASVEEFRKCQSFLHDYKITVYNYESGGKSTLFEGPEREKKINLLYFENH